MYLKDDPKTFVAIDNGKKHRYRSFANGEYANVRAQVSAIIPTNAANSRKTREDRISQSPSVEITILHI